MKYPHTRQWIDENDVQAVTAALREPLITRGPQVAAFEEALASYCGAEQAVVFNSGTSALHAAYFAAGLTRFDRVITSPNTYIGTVTGALSMGAQVTLGDIDRTTGAVEFDKLDQSILRAPSRGQTVLVPVHFAGHALDMCALDQLVTDPNAVIIEDAAHALGASYGSGERVGCCRFSDMTVLSLHPAKSITTGEGGAVLTRDQEIARRLRLFRNNGIKRSDPGPWLYEVQAATGNFHLTSFQAALGLSQLKRLDQIIARRRELASLYRQQLEIIPHLKLFSSESDHCSAHHLMVVQIDFEAYGTTREAVMLTLREQGIGTQVHYIPLYRHPVLSGPPNAFPQMEEYFAQALSLPLTYGLEEQDVTLICTALVSALEATRREDLVSTRGG